MVTQPIRFGVVGAGATGGYLAAALTDAGYDVTLLSRAASAAAIRAQGIRVHGPEGRVVTTRPSRVIEPGEDAEPVDVAIFCVKSYDTLDAADGASRLVGSDGIVLSLQNGLRSEAVLSSRFGRDRVLPGVLYVGAHRREPGVIERRTPARVLFGPPDPAERATEAIWEPLQVALEAAGVTCTLEEGIAQAKAEKFAFNCALNPLTALTRQRLGAIRSQPRGRELFAALVDEAATALAVAGFPHPSDVRERVVATADAMDISSSMAEDLAAGRRMELDAFTGHVLDLAAAHGSAAPVTEVVHGLLEVLDRPARDATPGPEDP